MAVDVSGSMLAGFEAQSNGALRVADFVQERPNDRIGLVVYASEAIPRLQLQVIKPLLRSNKEYQIR
jgi:Ca-activated chloride channel family protein